VEREVHSETYDEQTTAKAKANPVGELDAWKLIEDRPINNIPHKQTRQQGTGGYLCESAV
jgi:hypothetical protein